MRFSGTDRDENGPWFRLGNVDVTSTVFVLVLWVATLLVFIVEPVDKPVMRALAVVPDDVAFGQVWRLFTWPWSHAGFGLFDLIGAALFYIFGTELERQTGRKPFAWLLGASILIIGLSGTVLSLLLPGSTIIADLDLLGLAVLLLYIAEHPLRPFFFGIPAWVIGAVIVALEVVNDLAYRDWIRLLTIIVAAALIALVARKVGLLSEYDRVPDVRLPGRKRRRDDAAGSAGGGLRKPRSQASGAPKPSKKTRAKRSSRARPGRLWGGDQQDAEIVEMPPSRPVRPVNTTVPDDLSADDIALDLLLDKISDGGMDALSDAERVQLSELHARRRGRSSS